MSQVTALSRAVPPAPARSAIWPRLLRARTAIVLGGFLVGYFVLQIGVIRQRSATYDEPIHLLAGYAAIARGDYRVDPTHPPLLRMWAALPLLAMEQKAIGSAPIDQTTPERWLPQAYARAREFLYQGKNADQVLNASRMMMTVLGGLLGVLLFYWTRRWLGFTPATLALIAYLLEPNLSAHASLVTTDLGLTCFYFGAMYFLWRAGRHWSLTHAAGAALCFAAACASKFSAILLVPVGALLLTFMVARGTLTVRRAAGIVGGSALAAFVMIWAVYGFRYAPSATSGWVFQSTQAPVVTREHVILARVIGWIDAHHLLPNAFSQGFLLCDTLAEKVPGYLAGDISTEGWWYYFPFALLVKTPAALLVLATAGAILLAVRRRRYGSDNALFVGLPAVVYLVVAMTTSINIGVRHVLPVFPFLILAATAAVAEICRASWRPGVKFAVIGAVMVFWCDRFARVYPYTLTFFNQFAGGPANGANYLVDSNLDWGQHLKPLKQWMDAQGLSRINLAYFGTAHPAYYGIHGVMLPGGASGANSSLAPPELPGHVAISATLLSGVYFSPEWRLFYSGFKKLEPVAVIGNTIRVYRIDAWPNPAPAADGVLTNEEIELQYTLAQDLVQMRWHEQAIAWFKRYLRDRPNAVRAHAYLCRELIVTDRKREAADALRVAIALEPDNAAFHGSRAAMLFDLRDFSAAASEAREILRIQPRNGNAYDLLGLALANRGRALEALAAFERAGQLDAGSPLIRQHLELARRVAAVATAQATASVR